MRLIVTDERAWPVGMSRSCNKSWAVAERRPFGHKDMGSLGPHLTQCRLCWVLPPRQVASWSIQLFSHNTPTLETDRRERQRFHSIQRTVVCKGPIEMPFGLWTRVGRRKDCYMGTLALPGEYDWTVRVRRRCGRMWNYFDRLFHFILELFFSDLYSLASFQVSRVEHWFTPFLICSKLLPNNSVLICTFQALFTLWVTSHRADAITRCVA